MDHSDFDRPSAPSKPTFPKKFRLSSLLPHLIFLAIGAACGILVSSVGFGGKDIGELSFAVFMGQYLLQIGLLLLAYLVQLLLHEGGHLVFGLLSGYRFSSFRVGSLMLLRQNGQLRFKKLSLAGTAGQCLLLPPDPEDGHYPFLLYNLGGVLMNLITAMLFLAVSAPTYAAHPENLVLVFGIYLAMTGLAAAVTNGIPLRTALITNDGANVRMLAKDPLAQRAFWVQLRANALQVEGVRLKEMPADWFFLPEEADRTNSLLTTIEVLAENRLMDEQNFPAARAKIDFLLSDACIVAGLYRPLLELDRVFLDVLEHGAQADISPLNDKRNRAFLSSMKDFPSVLRTQYAVALLVTGDEAKQESLRARFEKIAAAYPSPSDIFSERELMALL